MNPEPYQNVVIGSGEPGKILAWNLAKSGQKTIVVERSMYGGSCPNVACLPSKNIIHSAKVASLLAHAAEFGLKTGPVQVDMAAVIRRKNDMIEGLMELHRGFFKASGTELVWGEGRFVEPKTVEVALNAGGTRLLYGERVFIAVGTRASVPKVSGLAESKPLTHVEALQLSRLPEHLVVLGGGYIGLEFAQAMRRFGCRVTILHRGPKLLDREDPDVSDALAQLMVDEGIDVKLNAEPTSVSGRSGDRVQLQVRSGSTTSTLDATDILVATGRTSNADRVNAAQGGVELAPNGYVRVNDRLETSAPGVWAMGECAGSPQFTHAGFDDFRIVHANLTGGSRSAHGRLIPYCLFTDPELAHVGLGETEAKAQKIPYRLAKIPMAAILRTRTLGETRGFAKALVADDDRILGFTAFGPSAGEIMAVVQTAILARQPFTLLRDAIFTHPTMSEGLIGLFSAVPPLTSKPN
jgi:pyruvate/2-oxoglutarate dehydrogenase complex dihydrolipoamide dehydrogenase (E3) component